MRWLANYLRQVFCKHDFVYSEIQAQWSDDCGGSRSGPKVSLLCKKCGYHKSFWKF